ncbi:Histone-lysine N-methyltransferase PRDM9 [Araneus ventricosus]|uniref:Histone-lysine N-methyltransferase PRDM9 n=1 Tax=Araneus ventricosus TaxID=182803 RepID=A0A4Y2J4Q5_ARAVE|nr:Histone-lysine N-methyltransferase PRDM9 [Araneus ventricosus]
MDEFECSWCRRSFCLKDGHFCFLEGKPDNEYSESFLDELEKLTEKLEAATRNQDCTSDDFGYSNTKEQGHDTQLNSSLGNDSNFCTKNIFRGQQVTSSPATSFITQCHGSSLDVSCSDSHVSAQQSIFEASEESHGNTLVVPDEASHGVFCRADDNQSNPFENFISMKDPGWSNLRPVSQRKRKNTSVGDDTNTCRKKANKSSAFNRQRKRPYLDSISASPTCTERDGNKVEAQETKDSKNIRDLSDKVTQIDDSSSNEITNNSAALVSVPDAEAVSVAGHSGIHIQSHRTGKEKRFLCKVCGKAFGQKTHLNAHHRTHTGEKHFACHMCDKRFTQQGDLTRHIRTHTGEKPFECHICSKGFGQKKLLVLHLRTHTGEKPFACHICRMGFARKHHLECHLRTHTGEKPFACHICRMGFARKHHLVCHLRTHTGEKPYKCKLCDMAFATQSNCKLHYKRKHSEK